MRNHHPPHENPGDTHGFCPMERDTLLDAACNCPDFVLHVHIRLATGATLQQYWLCFCCGNPIDRNHPYFGRSTA